MKCLLLHEIFPRKKRKEVKHTVLYMKQKCVSKLPSNKHIFKLTTNVSITFLMQYLKYKI